MAVRLKDLDRINKEKHYKKHKLVEEFAVGDVVLLKNRDNQTLDAPLAGPFEFVRYKDLKKSAAIIKDADEKEFDCSVSHLVPLYESEKRRKLMYVCSLLRD